jgi:HlyD family secretion protein
METARQAPAATAQTAAVSPVPAPLPTRMSWGKRILAALVVLAVAAMVAASLRPRPEPPLGVQTSPARKSPITRKVTAAGKLQAATQVKLSSNISGDLLELPVREGDVVKRGQFIGRIDSRRYAALVRQQEAARATAAADHTAARVDVSRFGNDLERVRRLAAGGNASAAELDRAQQDLRGAEARAQSAQERIAQAEALLADARQQLAYTTLTSPIDGVVTSRQKQIGERVRGGELQEDPIVIIATLSNMEVKVEVGEHEVVHLHLGDPAEVEVDAIPDKKWPAQVIEIARNANVRNPGTEQEVTTFPVRLALTAPVPGALPGMSAQASVSTETRKDAVVVPLQAITVRSEKELKGGPEAKSPEAGLPPPPGGPQKQKREVMRKVVFVVDGGVARVRPVEIGLASDAEVEVVEGLKEGETVVEGPYKVLARELGDGKAVRPLKPGEGAKLP